MLHRSVLLKESIDLLELHEGDVYFDATTGLGGHMEEIWKRFGDKVNCFGIDQDEVSLQIAEERLALLGAKPVLSVMNFRHLDKMKEMLPRSMPLKILFDLGWNSAQFEGGAGESNTNMGRGFSFQKDEPLLMTFKSKAGEDDTTAYDVVNRWKEENLADVIYGYGEEKYARRIARRIVERRKEKPIETSAELSEIVKSAVPVFYRFGRLHPATKTFQAIRIAVNDELNALQEGIRKGFELLGSEGRMAVISFHSLEDRIVKNFFKSEQNEEKGEIINKKPITPSDVEIVENPRSRSAKLRVIKKVTKLNKDE